MIRMVMHTFIAIKPSILIKRALKVNKQEVYQRETNESTNTQLSKKNSIKPKS